MTKYDKKGRLRGKKKLMIKALNSQLGVITAACKQVKISRETHYRWLREDKLYKKEAEDMSNITLDFAENALFKQIKKGVVPSTIFYLKTKGRKRGYVEHHEVEHSGIEGIKLIIEKANENNKIPTNIKTRNSH